MENLVSDQLAVVTVTVDRTRCAGHGVCVMRAQQLFDLDDDGLSVVLTPTTHEVQIAELAASNCPEHAITVKETS